MSNTKNVYTKEQILRKTEEASADMKSFYKSDFVNYRGKTPDNEKYTEIVAEYLLNHLDLFENIKSVSREKGYVVDSHNGTTENENSNREEERVAMDMFKENKSYDYIGKILDYQTPLKNTNNDAGLGKIDLLAVNEEYITILELKKEDSNETLLRCVLEAFTYLKIVDEIKLKESFNLEDHKLRAAAFVFNNKKQHNEFLSDYSNIKNLMKKLNIGMYVISKENNDYIVDIVK